MNRNILVMAHRGASGSAPENTLVSFHQAMELGADYAELDVQLSLDEQVVVLHDLTLERTTNLAGAVRDYTLAELQQADAGGWFAPQFAGERIPSLRQVMELVQGKMNLNIEVKKAQDFQPVVQGVIDMIHELNFKEVMITSFAAPALELARQIDPAIPTGLIFNKKAPKQQLAGEWGILCAKHTLVDNKFIELAHEAGKKLLVWTVNSRGDMLQMIALGVDGIISNYPSELKKVLKDTAL